MTRQDMIDCGYIPTFNHMAMKLEIISEQSLPSAHGKSSSISVTAKGKISFRKPICELLKLKQGGLISFVRDKETDELYITTNAKDGFTIKSQGQIIGIQSVELINRYFPKNLFKDKKSVLVTIAETPIVYDNMNLHLVQFPKK